MHPVKIHAKQRRTVLSFVLALGLGLPSPAQAYLLDFTVASINPGVLISYAGALFLPDPLRLKATRLLTLAAQAIQRVRLVRVT